MTAVSAPAPALRVLVVDDSAVARRVLADALARHADLAVVGAAADAYEARAEIARLRPDVVTLDLEMPRMDGLTFLAKLMRHHPTPVVVVSGFGGAAGPAGLAERALALGASAVLPKPGRPDQLAGLGDALARAVRGAARGAGRAAGRGAAAGAAPPSPRVLAVGASTGGTQAIERLLRALPAGAPGAVVVQHMPAGFTAAFAARLDALCAVRVREAVDGDPVRAGVALVAPGGRHAVLERTGDAGAPYAVRVTDGPPVHHQRPAADVLFASVARHAGPDGIGVLLTGMGVDGARGLLAMRAAGAHTIAQDEATSVVYGMPREAARLGAAAEVLPLGAVAAAVLRAAAAPPGAAPAAPPGAATTTP